MDKNKYSRNIPASQLVIVGAWFSSLKEKLSTDFGFLILPGSLGPVDEGLSDLPNLEHGRSLDIIPILAGEGIHDLLLGTLLATFG